MQYRTQRSLRVGIFDSAAAPVLVVAEAQNVASHRAGVDEEVVSEAGPLLDECLECGGERGSAHLEASRSAGDCTRTSGSLTPLRRSSEAIWTRVGNIQFQVRRLTSSQEPESEVESGHQVALMAVELEEVARTEATTVRSDERAPTPGVRELGSDLIEGVERVVDL